MVSCIITGRFFFEDLARDNDSKSTKILKQGVLTQTDMPHLGYDRVLAAIVRFRYLCPSPYSPDFYKSFVIGEQMVSKYKDKPDAANLVHIYLADIRLPSVAADLIITYNVPIRIAEESSSKGAVTSFFEDNLPALQSVLSTFDIRDWNLFGGQGEAVSAEPAGDPNGNRPMLE